MKNLIIGLTLLTLLFALAAKADLSDSPLVPKEEMEFAKDYLSQIRSLNFDYVLSHIDPEISSQVSQEELEKIAAHFPSGELFSTELIGSQSNTFNSNWQGNFTFEYEFESSWALANLVMKRVDDKTTVIGFNVYKTTASQKELNKFVLSGKTLLHYLVLVFACIVPVFILVTLVYCIKAPIPKRKWLWVLFVLGGIGTISINWSTGMYGIKLFHYQLFGAGIAAASEYSPWIISAGLPIGAAMFWFKRKSFIAQANRLNQQETKDADASV